MVLRSCLLTLLPLALSAQQPAFDVASIKPNASGDHRIMFRMAPGGAFNVTGANLRMLIMQAYDVKDFQITGGPSWLASDRWDINAKADGLPAQVPRETMQAMMQGLLADRFQLKLHKESKELPAYALVAGKGPHKMKASQSTGERRQMFRMGRGQANLQAANMAAVANLLSQQLGRPVVDKTGITGEFDIEMHWTPEPGQGGGPFGGAPPPPEAIASSDNSGPSLLTAVQEQLGLKLESQKLPVPILVIDSVSKPTEN